MLSLSSVSLCRSQREWAGERERAGELPMPELPTGSTEEPPTTSTGKVLLNKEE